MTHSQYEPMVPLDIVRPPAPRRGGGGRRWPALMGGAVLLALAVAASWTSQRQIDTFLTQLDVDALQTAKKIYDRSLEEQRAHVLSQVGVLAEDTRIRATVIMPNSDEATIRDVLKDLMATSGAGLMAVLDVNGKVKAVTGAEGLREIDLGSSSVVKAAVERPSAYIWTFPQQVLAVGVAPIRSHEQVYAFLVMGFEAAKPALSAIKGSVGVLGAVVIGDKVVASATDEPALAQAFRTGAAGEIDKDMLIDGGERRFFARVTRVNDSVAAAKVIWMIPQHSQSERISALRLAIWTPSLAAGLILALTLVVSRRDGKAS
jgi:hypothetical protein